MGSIPTIIGVHVNRNKFYVTTPLYYVNSKPHLGTLYSTVLADISARWKKLLGKKVFFLTGTDEHGQKIQERAQVEGKDPKQFVDTMIPLFKKTWNLFDINYTKFIRTTDPEHEQAVIYWIKKLMDQGDIYKSNYTGLYCVPCETFVTVNTDTPKDASGKHVCPSCNRELREVAEESYFFRLSAYQDQLLEFYENNPDFITPKERLHEIISFVKSGLKDLSISRKTITWGIPFPGDASHTVYVWGDALLNYISAIGYGQDNKDIQDQFRFWWAADVQIMAKDIARFHAIYWPAFLIAVKLPLPKKLLVHGYILMGDQKMSKSLGNAIDPEQLAQWYGVDQVRYYLLRQMAITQDGQFSLKDIEERITADLANNLGNLLNRMVTLATNNGLTHIVAPPTLEPVTIALKEKCEEAFRAYWEHMETLHFHTALSELWKFVASVNAYFHAQQPWKLVNTNKELFAETIHATAQSLYTIGVLLWPVMPHKMEILLTTLGQTFAISNSYEPELRENRWNKTFTLMPTNEQLFARPESHVPLEPQVPDHAAQIDTQKEFIPQEIITIHDFAKIHAHVGTVLTCENISGSDKLYKLLVDLGPLGKRQILSGVALDFKPDDLINKQGIFVTNLAPRKMMGLVSQGMMLFAKNNDGRTFMLTVSGVVENGTQVS